MANGFQASLDLTAQAMVRRCFTVAELDAMFDAQILSRDERIELIDGDIVQVNSQLMPHAILKSRLARKLMALMPETFDVIVEGSMAVSDVSVLEPDLMITSRLPDERRYVRPTEVLLAIEVADSSLRLDLGKKAQIYCQAGIRELWVVDIQSAQTRVHRGFTETDYVSVVAIAFDAPLTPLAFPDLVLVVGSI